MKAQPDIATLVSRFPDADEPGKESKFTGPDFAEAEKTFAEILAGGRDAVLATISLVKDPGDPEYKDFRAQYVLHGLALVAGKPGNDDMRRMFAQAAGEALVAMKLTTEVRAMLVRELQAAGGKESIAALGGLLADEALGDPAAMALVAIGAPAIEELRKALPGAKGKRRVAIIQALGCLGDAVSTAAFREAAKDPDRAARIAAVDALSAIGGVEGAGEVLGAAKAEDGWERSRGVKASFVLAEKLAAAGRKDVAKSIYEGLAAERKDPKEAYIREAAERGLRAL